MSTVRRVLVEHHHDDDSGLRRPCTEDGVGLRDRGHVRHLWCLARGPHYPGHLQQLLTLLHPRQDARGNPQEEDEEKSKGLMDIEGERDV